MKIGVQEILVLALFIGAVAFLLRKFLPIAKKKPSGGSCDKCDFSH